MTIPREAFSKWTDEYLLRLWGKRRVIDVEIKKVIIDVATAVKCCELCRLKSEEVLRCNGPLRNL